jgi:hypothetical protein
VERSAAALAVAFALVFLAVIPEGNLLSAHDSKEVKPLQNVTG